MLRLGLVLFMLVAAAPLSAQTISRRPVPPARGIATDPKPAPAPPRARPFFPDEYYYPAWHGYQALPYVVPTYVQQSPPTAVGEVAPPRPGPAMAWIGGSWTWSGAGYYWVSGQWAPIPAGYTTWVPGRWTNNHLGWFWLRGYWA